MMYIFKGNKEEILKGRSTRYVANEILSIHEFYLGDILRGKKGCSIRLARDITKCANENANIKDYFITKED